MQYQGGRHGGWCTWGCLQRRLLAKAGENKQHVGSKKAFKLFAKTKWTNLSLFFFQVSETPPPSYEEALYRNSVRLPGLQVSSIFSFLQSFPSSILSSSWIFPVSCFVFSRLLCLALSSVFTFISPPGAFDCPPLLITTHLILYLILFCISDGDPNQSCGCHSGRHIFALSASHFWSSPYILLDKYFNSTTTLFWSAGLEFVSHIGCKIYFYVYALTGY